MSRLDRLPQNDGPPQAEAPPSIWSAPLGVYAGTPVRVHVSLAITLILAAGACVHAGSSTGWLALAVYAVSLLAHEAAHLAASGAETFRFRFAREPIVIGPLGGMQVASDIADPRERVFVAMAGPVASLALVVGSMCCLASAEGARATQILGDLLTTPYDTLAGETLAGAEPAVLLAALLAAINWPLFVLNLAPASPFNGGVALRAWLSLWLGEYRARDVVCTVALLVAAGLVGAAGALVAVEGAPAWFGAPLAVLGVVVAFGARADAVAASAPRNWQVASEDDYIGMSLDELQRDVGDQLVMADMRLATRHVDGDDPDEPREELSDEDRLDRILAKVHTLGVDGLTPDERAVLQRASQKYRRRRGED